MKTSDPTVSFGFTEQRFRFGGHICYIDTDEAERQHVMGKFIESGLASGEKVVYLVDRPRAQTETEAYLAVMKVSVNAGLRPGQFVLAEAERTYCPDGTFRPER